MLQALRELEAMLLQQLPDLCLCPHDHRLLQAAHGQLVQEAHQTTALRGRPGGRAAGRGQLVGLGRKEANAAHPHK